MLPEPRFALPRFQSPWLPEPKFKLPTLPIPRLKVGAVSALGVGVATVAFVAPVVIDHGFAGVAGSCRPVAAGADVAASEMTTVRVETPAGTDPAGSSSPTDPDAAAAKAAAALKAAQERKAADPAEAARQAEAEARAEEQRRTAEVQKVADETRIALERARLDADSAADAGRRLRTQIATLTASCRAASSDSGTAIGGQATDATADLLADVQRRIDEATDRIAAHADAATAAGTACQRSYEALMR
jgi:hypothetical protein